MHQSTQDFINIQNDTLAALARRLETHTQHVLTTVEGLKKEVGSLEALYKSLPKHM